ncbi:rap guanine nucleotide exchange factor 4-like isoform X3 [Dysidea avara]|uniref:rap guanine nucleotide exchange factor 4-like isoform X3 n=1 Tax=Dysidea avara TaxID=196820 RepID=UPI00332AD48A
MRAYRAKLHGDVGTHWYAVISGSLDVCLVDSDCPEKNISICSIGEGDTFGESIIFGGKRSASVITLEPCELLCVEANYMKQLYENHSDALKGIISVGVATDMTVSDQADDSNRVATSNLIPSVNFQPAKSGLWMVGMTLYQLICEQFPDLLKTYQINLFTYKNCSSGGDLVDWVVENSAAPRTRTEVVRMWQALLEERVIHHVFNVHSFKDDPSLMYKFHNGLKQESSESNSPDNVVEQRQHYSTSSSFDTDTILEDSFEMWASLAPEALVSASLTKSPDQRTEEDIDFIYEEMVNIKAFSHFSQTVKSELSKCIIIDEFKEQTGRMLFHQGDEGTSWYIIYKGSVNVIVHGKGIVCTLHEGDEFGKLALVNNAPRAASIQLREAHCSFLRVDKEDFNRILKSVEANTVRLQEHGHDVLVLEKINEKYSVVLGTPDKVIDHLIDKKVDENETEDELEMDFFLTLPCFISTSEVCTLLLSKYQGKDVIKENTTLEQKRTRKERVVKGVLKWIEIGRKELVAESIFMRFINELCSFMSDDNFNELLSTIQEKVIKYSPSRRISSHMKALSTTAQSSIVKINKSVRGSSASITVGLPPCEHSDQVTLNVYTADHRSCQLVVTRAACAKDVLYHVTKELALPSTDYKLYEVKSSGEYYPFHEANVSLDTSLSVNGRIFLLPSDYSGRVQILKEQDNLSIPFPFDKENSKDIACHLMLHSYELLRNISFREVIYSTCGKHKFSRITSNIDLIVRKFNEIQFWVISEVCGSPDVTVRARILSKFIKIAAYCKDFKDLNSFFAIVFGIMNGAVYRLKTTWEKVPTKLRRKFESFETLTDPSRNHRAIRIYQGKLVPPAIPFMPLLLKDATFICEGNETHIDGLVNFEKMRMLSAKARTLKDLSCGALDAEIISTTVRTPELRQAVRNLKVIDNQRTLNHMSNSIEKRY